MSDFDIPKDTTPVSAEGQGISKPESEEEKHVKKQAEKIPTHLETTPELSRTIGKTNTPSSGKVTSLVKQHELLAVQNEIHDISTKISVLESSRQKGKALNPLELEKYAVDLANITLKGGPQRELQDRLIRLAEGKEIKKEVKLILKSAEDIANTFGPGSPAKSFPDRVNDLLQGFQFKDDVLIQESNLYRLSHQTGSHKFLAIKAKLAKRAVLYQRRGVDSSAEPSIFRKQEKFGYLLSEIKSIEKAFKNASDAQSKILTLESGKQAIITNYNVMLVGDIETIGTQLGKGASKAAYLGPNYFQTKKPDVAREFVALVPKKDDEAHQKEIKVTQELQDPEGKFNGIVKLHTVANVNGKHVMVQEAAGYRFKGTDIVVRDLFDLFALQEGVSVEEVAGLVAQALEDILLGLETMHNKGYTHNDLKPENILITTNGRAVLADFGEANKIHEKDTAEGTPEYYAPERLKGIFDKQDNLSTEKSDIYSFGIILYQAIASPFATQVTGRPLQTTPLQGNVNGILEKQLPEDATQFQIMKMFNKEAKQLHDQNKKASMLDNDEELIGIDFDEIPNIEKEMGIETLNIIQDQIKITHGCLKIDPNQRPSIPEIREVIQMLRLNQ